MLKHRVGTQDENTIECLKKLLGVSVLNVILLDSVEEFYWLLGEEPDSVPPEPQVQ